MGGEGQLSDRNGGTGPVGSVVEGASVATDGSALRTVLSPFVEAGVFGAFEVELAATVLRLEPGASAEDLLALALAARAPRHGHVCVELDHVVDQVVSDEVGGPLSGMLPWPESAGWADGLDRSPIVQRPDAPADRRTRPLVWDGRRVYLERYWRYEVDVADELRRRAEADPAPEPPGPSRHGDVVEGALDRLFGTEPDSDQDLQRQAVRWALTHGVSIIAGGPGTGKTHTIARILAAAHLVAEGEGGEVQAALAAPTGKAAARMAEAVQSQLRAMQRDGVIGTALAEALSATEPTTVHRLLGHGDRTHFRHNHSDPLVHDLVVIDETSMVSLPLMAKLLAAVRPDARLVLVGDPFQLASIEAGTVMGDLVDRGGVGAGGWGGDGVGGGDGDGCAGGPLDGRVTELRRGRRFGAESGIAALAASVRVGDVDAVLGLLAGARPDVAWIDEDDALGLATLRAAVEAAGVEVVEAALAGDADTALEAAGRIKVLAATRRGPFGLYEWTDRIEAVAASVLPPVQRHGPVPVGTPVIVTGNDPVNRLFNGDVGVVVLRDGNRTVAMGAGAGAGDLRYLALARLREWERWWAMTIHKSQGSEYPHAVVSLPSAGSPILTRELLYTAVTRATSLVTVVGSEESIRAAVTRPVARASGLRDRLWT
jgi:exodeoxyribonuclease V alpha subunit